MILYILGKTIGITNFIKYGSGYTRIWTRTITHQVKVKVKKN